MGKKISIIILNYNGLHFLKKCLPTIIKQTFSNYEVIIADNFSSDQSVSWLESESKKWKSKGKVLKIIKNQTNLGFAKGNNEAIKYATGDFLFFLNNDTELFPDTLKQLVLNHKPKSVMTARQIPLMDKKYIGNSGAGMDIFGYPYVDDNPRKTRIFYADGVALFIDRKDFVKIGMFDAKLFMFQEDIDLSWRAQMYGYSVLSCWNARLYHYGGGTALGGHKKGNKYVSGYLRRYMNEKNIIRNLLKNYSFPLCLLLLSILLAIHFCEIMGLIILQKPRAAVCYLRAYKWNILNINDTLTLRRVIQGKRQVSDFELMKKMYFRYSKLMALRKVGIPEFR